MSVTPNQPNPAASFAAQNAKQKNPSHLKVAMDNLSADPSNPLITRDACDAIRMAAVAILGRKTDYQTVQDVAQKAAHQIIKKAARGESVNATYARQCIKGHFNVIVQEAMCEKRGGGQVYTYGDIPESVDQEESNPLDALIKEEEYRQLRVHVAELPWEVGKAMTMRFFDGATFQSVADALGCSKAQAHNLTRKGISLLQQAMA